MAEVATTCPSKRQTWRAFSAASRKRSTQPCLCTLASSGCWRMAATIKGMNPDCTPLLAVSCDWKKACSAPHTLRTKSRELACRSKALCSTRSTSCDTASVTALGHLELQMLRIAADACSCTSLSSGCTFMAVRTASRPPTSTTACWRSALFQAMLRKAMHPCTCRAAQETCKFMAATIAPIPPACTMARVLSSLLTMRFQSTLIASVCTPLTSA
mmetsp:Transcript_6387/g.15692  ORF Transcript_6387/g.15692 Transcript_6387/m.15692 type:complete len:215 (-) Transcript_6387:753-1397(-)